MSDQIASVSGSDEPVVIIVEDGPAVVAEASEEAVIEAPVVDVKRPARKPAVLTPGRALSFAQALVEGVYLPLSRLDKSRKAMAELFEARKSIKEASPETLNDAMKIAAVFSWMSKFTQFALDEAVSRLRYAQSKWDGKATEWSVRYGVQADAFYARYEAIAAKYEGMERDRGARDEAIKLAKEMFLFTENNSVRQPYGACAGGCGKAIMPTRDGRLFPKCRECGQRDRLAKKAEGTVSAELREQIATDPEFEGITLSLATPVTEEYQPKKTKTRKAGKKSEEPKVARAPRNRRNEETEAIEASINED
jgi:hypothetical protein